MVSVFVYPSVCVCFGAKQMCWSYANDMVYNFLWTHRYQFIPQIIFLNGLFGYLALLIIIKWCTGSTADLYHVMIYMFLSPTAELGENQLFPGQRYVQVISVVVANYVFVDMFNFTTCWNFHWILLIPDDTSPSSPYSSSMDASSQTIDFEVAPHAGKSTLFNVLQGALYITFSKGHYMVV